MVVENEAYRVAVSAELHVAKLLPGPIGVELSGPHERNVHAKPTVHRRAVQTDEHPVRHRRPRRVLRVAVEAYLSIPQRTRYHWTYVVPYFPHPMILTLFAGIDRNLWKIASISLFVGPESAIFDVLSRCHINVKRTLRSYRDVIKRSYLSSCTYFRVIPYKNIAW